MEQATVLNVVEQGKFWQRGRTLDGTKGAEGRSIHAVLQAARLNELQQLLEVRADVLILLDGSGAGEAMALLLHASKEKPVLPLPIFCSAHGMPRAQDSSW